MNDQELLESIKKQLANKVSPEKIKLSLLSSGWLEEKVDESLLSLGIKILPVENIKPSKLKVEVTKPFSKKFMLGMVLFIFILTGGGVYAYSNYFISPERILFKSLAKMSDIKSAEYSGQLNFESFDTGLFDNVNEDGALPFDMSSLTGQNSKFSFQVNALSDVGDIYNPKFMIKLASAPEADKTPSDAGGEVRFFGKDKLYANLTDIPADFFGGLDLSLLEEKWIEFELKDFIKNEASDTESTKDNSKNPPEIMFKLETIKESLPSLIKLMAQTADEKVDDVEAYHYEVLFDSEKIARLYFDLVTENKNFTELQKNSLKEKAGTLGLTKGDIWVGKKDLLIYKINLVINQKNGVSKTELSLKIKNHDMPVVIETPSEAKTLKELMSDILASILSGGNTETISTGDANMTLDLLTSTSTSATVQEITPEDLDGDLLNNVDEEAVWHTDPNNPDTDGDGYLDGYEVKNGFNPNGEGKLPVL